MHSIQCTDKKQECFFARQDFGEITIFHYSRWDSWNPQFSVSAGDGAIALKKAHTHCGLSVSSLPKVALKTVAMFVLLNTDHSLSRGVECWLLLFSTPLSFSHSVQWCSGLSTLRKFLKPVGTTALSSYRPGVMSAVLASLFPVKDRQSTDWVAPQLFVTYLTNLVLDTQRVLTKWRFRH